MKLAYIETYGCQMNFSDTEIVASVLKDMGYGFTSNEHEADLVFINTCSIRDNAESKVWKRLKNFRKQKSDNPGLMVGVLGCMAERLKTKLLDEEKLVDLVVGPDAYRDLPRLLDEVEGGQRSVNVLLSREETYANIAPVRLNSNGVSAFVTIMRGCDNMCTFCVVPFTRGRERSRDPYSIVEESRQLYDQGFREVTLLGQNVDSYKWSPDDSLKGKAQINKAEAKGEEIDVINFAQLLEMVANVAPDLRVRFSTSHPKDITDDVLHAMAKYKNICNYIHLPVQSGSSRVLELMNRGYSLEWYKQKVDRIYELIPDCAISTDIITGFCTETEEDHEKTIEVVNYARYSHAYMFAYSERPGTPAAKKMEDDVPEADKKRRLAEVIKLQNEISRERNLADVGKEFVVLIEGNSKRSEHDWCGRNDQNKMIVFPKQGDLKPGDYVIVKVKDATSATLLADMVSAEVQW
ncbi:tRNA (N6-isopentenyl adenosine(37)-C2)-methylthiotransferase MiaB [Pontibacter sp. G13]|nr:tRNA (N6-isopentenyl adenosine(37)-C2)-methylthiotransferase MiaB [Pontibacter sp. G13]WNJ21541.1 tRNA (N6-isopentenyl adenosine(37)-C2)-methylthiotransferase MiaB [Pontibacter sp. G13]